MQKFEITKDIHVNISQRTVAKLQHWHQEKALQTGESVQKIFDDTMSQLRQGFLSNPTYNLDDQQWLDKSFEQAMKSCANGILIDFR